MANIVSSALFCVRNADKTENGEYGRFPVTVGQGAAVLKAWAQSNSESAKTIKSIFSSVKEISKSNKAVDIAAKSAKFASEHINPLIVASSGLKVVMADQKDRKDVIIAETGCLTGMFMGEGWMKKNLAGIIEKTPIPKKYQSIVKGVAFVIGSIGASTVGQTIGEKIAPYWDKPLKTCFAATPTTQSEKDFFSDDMNIKA